MKNIFVEEREVRQPKLIHALITFCGLIAVMAVGIIVFEVDPRAFVIANKAHEVLGEGFRQDH